MNQEEEGLWIRAIYYCKHIYDFPPSWENLLLSIAEVGCVLLMGEKRPLFVVLWLWNVSTTSGIEDEKVKMFCQHQWITIKMKDAFNENHVMNTYQASLEGEMEAQETEKWTTPHSPTVFITDTFGSSSSCSGNQRGSSLAPLRQLPLSLCNVHLCSLNF